jgi:ethylmalonyl-CoA/methylmalonyl-CoA decarboxylase
MSRSLAEACAVFRDFVDQRPPREGRIALGGSAQVAEVVIDYPSARNALTPDMMLQLAEAVIALERDPRPVVVLRSASPGMFCSGGHLAEVRGVWGSPEAGFRMGAAMSAVLDAFAALPLLSVAWVDGPAIGGGAELLTACDHRVLGPRARVRFAQAALGVAPGWGGAARLVECIGRTSALRLLTRAEDIGPAEAVRLGLADALVEGEAGLQEFVAPILRHPAEAIRAIKAQVASHFSRSTDAESRAFASVWMGAAHRRAVGAEGA